MYSSKKEEETYSEYMLIVNKFKLYRKRINSCTVDTATRKSFPDTQYVRSTT